VLTAAEPLPVLPTTRTTNMPTHAPLEHICSSTSKLLIHGSMHLIWGPWMQQQSHNGQNTRSRSLHAFHLKKGQETYHPTTRRILVQTIMSATTGDRSDTSDSDNILWHVHLIHLWPVAKGGIYGHHFPFAFKREIPPRPFYRSKFYESRSYVNNVRISSLLPCVTRVQHES
jgi:hypothetical protein